MIVEIIQVPFNVSVELHPMFVVSVLKSRSIFSQLITRSICSLMLVGYYIPIRILCKTLNI